MKRCFFIGIVHPANCPDLPQFGHWRSARAAGCVLLMLFFLGTPAARAQSMDDSVVSKHVRIQVPAERMWLGRETITDLETCWGIIDAATHAGLPSRVLVVLDIRSGKSAIDADRGAVTIGLANAGPVKNLKGFLLHGAAREMARLALTNLSGGAAARPENRFLLEGMSELLAHDTLNTVRQSSAAWVLGYFQDRIKPIGLQDLSAGFGLSEGNHNLQTAAGSMTFLTVCRDLYGRERVLKLFESLAKKSLEQSVTSIFKTSINQLEAEWLDRMRKVNIADVTATVADEAPILEKIQYEPDPASAGAMLQVRIFTRDNGNDLLPDGVFIMDESSDRAFSCRRTTTATAAYSQCTFAVAADARNDPYSLRIIAVDEVGNVRSWNASYAVAR
jgi:hypothetical protein